MTLAEKITMVKTLANESDLTDAFVTVYLNKAESAIRNRMYPFNLPLDSETGEPITFTVPAKYEMLQCELACNYILKRGGEGEIRHDENGISRTYDSVNEEKLLMEVMQVII